MLQYEVVLANLDSTKGSEFKKKRPCLVISPNEMNEHLNTIVIAPITSTSKPYPTRYEINLQNIKGWVALDQIRTINKLRIIKTLDLLNIADIYKVKKIIQQTFVD